VLFHRTAAEQLAFWADLGRLVESKLSRREVSELMNGSADIRVVYPDKVEIDNRGDTDIVVLSCSHQTKKRFNETATQIKANIKGPIYESAQDQPGLLKRTSPDGSVDFGIYKNGKFKKTDRF